HRLGAVERDVRDAVALLVDDWRQWISSMAVCGKLSRPMAATYPVKDKVVMVTGAARGIGAEAARQLAGRGARVALVGLEPEELQGVAGQCGPEAAWFEADVTDRGAVAAAVAGTVDRFGKLDVVVANEIGRAHV